MKRNIPKAGLDPGRTVFRTTLIIFVVMVSWKCSGPSGTSETKEKSYPDFEGKVSYSITYENIPPEMEQYKGMLPNESTFYVKDGKGRLEQSMGMSGQQVMILDSETDSMTMLVDLMGQKIRVQGGPEQTMGTRGDPDAERKVEYKDETKTIAGYECKKAVVTTRLDGKEQEQTVFYTESIPPVHNSFKKLKGFPLQFTAKVQGMTRKTVAEEVVEKEIAETYFDTDPEGYEDKTWKEFMDKYGRNMGGGG